ncbi:hypothetical protein Lepto7375DRAFT_7259 [Leptolyngbya sp. PCC 7375]|nr:hypothetical protein Lepto7375DRAFT_7259 [Leptolyngbya sp. PCC 7375]
MLKEMLRAVLVIYVETGFQRLINGLTELTLVMTSDENPIETAIRLWGYESVCEAAKQFSFDGWPKDESHG